MSLLSRIFMNEQLQWTLQATCSGCAHETTASLHMGTGVQCTACGAPIHIDPETTVFHRAGGSGYWNWH
jgi:ribosomal protein S27E